MVQVSETVMLDCDAVLLQWWPAFAAFASERLGRRIDVDGQSSFDMRESMGLEDPADIFELVWQFNAGKGSGFGDLEPVEGAVQGVQDILDSGSRIVIVTSCMDTPDVVDARCENLWRVFGRDAFDRIHCLDPKTPKATIFSLYPASLYVDDDPRNVIAAAEMGHDAYGIAVPTNRDMRTELAPSRWISWSDIQNACAPVAPAL